MFLGMDAPTVQVAILASQAVILGLFGYLTARIRSVRRDVKATHRQVVNDHPNTPNMRDEFDHRHRENRRALRWIGYTLVRVLADVESLQTFTSANRRRIRELESTTRRSRRMMEEDDTAPTPVVAMPLGDVPAGVAMPWDVPEDETER